jgi:hypothetical protein
VALTWRGRPLDVVVCEVPAEYVLEEVEDLL